MSSPALLPELATLVAALRAPDASVDARRAAVRAAARAARRSALALRLTEDRAEADGVRLRDDEAAGAGELLHLLRAAGVSALHVRQHASARELAQLVGVLLRRQHGGDTSELSDELATLRLWSVRVVTASRRAAPGALTGDAAALVRRMAEACDCATREALFDEVAAWAERTLAPFVAPVGDAPSDPPAARAAVDAVARTIAALAHRSSTGEADGAAGAHEPPPVHTAALVRALARVAAAPGAADAVVDALARGVLDAAEPLLPCVGEAIVPLLVERLATAGAFEERRRCVDALLAVRSGVDALVAALGRPEWYAVRNVALVLGELRAEDAYRALARTLTHADDRVRVAAAVALGQIGTLPARRAMLAALNDRSPEVRRLAARAAVDVARAGVPLGAAMLLHALVAEDDVDTAAELVSALTALGTVEARDGLARLATGRVGGPPDAVGRLAAMSALAAQGGAWRHRPRLSA